jgi:hypothetical protein
MLPLKKSAGLNVRVNNVLPPSVDFTNFALFVAVTFVFAGLTLYLASMLLSGIQTQAYALVRPASDVPVTSNVTVMVVEGWKSAGEICGSTATFCPNEQNPTAQKINV